MSRCGLGHYSCIGRPWVNPRHSPRAFPLGLLAPRLLGAVLVLATAPCSALARAPLLFGGRKESFPQLRSPPRSGGVEFIVLYYIYIFLELCRFVFPTFGVRPRTTPIHIFIIEFVVSLSLPISVTSITAALIKTGRPSGNARGYTLCV